MDVTDPQNVVESVTKIGMEYDSIDVAILNAGDYRTMPADSFDREFRRYLMEVKYMSAVNCVSALLPGMLERDKGELMLMSSVAGWGLP